MTGSATFGDLLHAAGRRLDEPADGPEPVPKRRQAAARTRQVREASHALLAVITVMTRYAADITGTAFGEVPDRDRRLLNPWARAAIEAREALDNAAAFLRQAGADRPGAASPHSPLARRLHAAATSLATGRDLLHTHFAAGPDGSPGPLGLGARHKLRPGHPGAAARAGFRGPADRPSGRRDRVVTVPGPAWHGGGPADAERLLPVAVGAGRSRPGRPPPRSRGGRPPRAAARHPGQRPPGPPHPQRRRTGVARR